MDLISSLLNIPQDELGEGISALLDLVASFEENLGTRRDASTPEAIQFQRIYPLIKGLVAGEYSQLIHFIMLLNISLK